MTDNCRHWTHDEDKDTETIYCRDCFIVLTPNPYWSGTIKIGKMESYINVDQNYLDLRDVIGQQIGANVELYEVRFTGETYYRPDYFVSFLVGKTTMYADITGLAKNTRYEPTDRFFAKPVELEEELAQ